MLTSIAKNARALAALGGLSIALTATAQAQYVPRFVDYPAAQPVCHTGPAAHRSHTVTLSRKAGESAAMVRVYAGSDCASDALLFTARVSVAQGGARVVHVTPTSIGASSLSRECDQYAWTPGNAVEVAQDRCQSINSVFVAMGTPQRM